MPSGGANRETLNDVSVMFIITARLDGGWLSGIYHHRMSL